jgi:hypothetical protein
MKQNKMPVKCYTRVHVNTRAHQGRRVVVHTGARTRQSISCGMSVVNVLVLYTSTFYTVGISVWRTPGYLVKIDWNTFVFGEETRNDRKRCTRIITRNNTLRVQPKIIVITIIPTAQRKIIFIKRYVYKIRD